MTLECIQVQADPEKSYRTYKCDVTISKQDTDFEIRLDGFFANDMMRLYPISLKQLSESLKNRSFRLKDVSFVIDDFGQKQECSNILCDDKNVNNLVIEILKIIESKIGDFQKITFEGGAGFLALEELKIDFPDIKII